MNRNPNKLHGYDGYSDRLRFSRNLAERRSIIVGRHSTDGFPVLLDTDLLLEHMHILGSTGSGKTALALMTTAIQLIRRNDGAVVVLDNKGDPALFNTVRIEAERAGRTFKWFTNKPSRSTYVFNPFDSKVLRRLSLQEILGLVIQSLNLHHGDDYGRAWFSIAARTLLKHSLEESLGRRNRPGSARRSSSLFPVQTIQSFQDLDDAIRFLSMEGGKDYEAAKHLGLIVNALADFPQLNLSPGRNPNHSALKHAIHMREAVRDKQVIYFYLTGAMDQVSVAEIARLAMYSLLAATMNHREEFGETPRAYCLCDEAQLVIAQNIANVLAQARSYGLACILAHQTMSQLNPPGGVDLRELVMVCTCIKQYFSARDPWLQEYISDNSGRTNYFSLGYDQHVEDVMVGNTGAPFAAVDLDDGYAKVRVQEYPGPRLTPQEIQEVSRRDNLCFYSVDHARAMSRHHGFFPMWVDWPMPVAEYRRRQDSIPWPAPTEATIVVAPDWPDDVEAPVTPQPATGATARRLRDMQRRLEEEGNQDS